MVRIKGANSDYKYVGDPQQPIAEDKTQDLYMELFICPNDQPSKIEQHEGENYCQGTDQDCPSQEKKGHAKIRLDQTQGIILSVKNTEAVKVSDQKIVLQLGNTPQDNTIEMTSEEISLQTKQAKISLKSNGDIELQGKVTFTGDTADVILPEATKERLKAEIKQEILAEFNQ